VLEEERVRVGAREARAVDPGEIGRFDVRHRQAEARFDEIAVGAQVVDLRRQPLLAIAQRRERGLVAEHRGRRQYVCIHIR